MTHRSRTKPTETLRLLNDGDFVTFEHLTGPKRGDVEIVSREEFLGLYEEGPALVEGEAGTWETQRKEFKHFEWTDAGITFRIEGPFQPLRGKCGSSWSVLDTNVALTALKIELLRHAAELAAARRDIAGYREALKRIVDATEMRGTEWGDSFINRVASSALATSEAQAGGSTS